MRLHFAIQRRVYRAERTSGGPQSVTFTASQPASSRKLRLVTYISCTLINQPLISTQHDHYRHMHCTAYSAEHILSSGVYYNKRLKIKKTWKNVLKRLQTFNKKTCRQNFRSRELLTSHSKLCRLSNCNTYLNKQNIVYSIGHMTQK